MAKKVYKRKCFSGPLKNQIFKGGRGTGNEKPVYWRDCLKRGTWVVCKFKRRLGEKKGVEFLRRGLIPQCTLWGNWSSLQILEHGTIRAQSKRLTVIALNLSFFFAVCFFLSIHMTCFCNNFSSLFLVFSLVKCSTILEITSEIFGKFSRIYWQLNSFLTEEQNIRQQFNLKRAPTLLSFYKIFSRIFKNSCSGQHL